MKINLTKGQYLDMCQLINATSGLVKTVVGIGNNAAWAACLDAIDQIRKHPRYRQQIKGGTTPQKQFKRAFDMLKDYQRTLIYTNQNRFFHVADMSPKTRKVYGPDFSDADYYDFWSAFGFQAYQSTKPFFTSLVNKLRLAYEHHGDPEPEIMGWAVAAQCALDIAAGVWQSAVNNCDTMQREYSKLDIPQSRWEFLYKDFNLLPIANFWEKCVDCLAPKSNYALTELEKKNIKDGYEQLENMWMNEDTLYGSRIKTAEDYADIFRTNGEMKKAMRSFAEMRDKVANEGKA